MSAKKGVILKTGNRVDAAMAKRDSQLRKR
jgi:hypothetical protein